MCNITSKQFIRYIKNVLQNIKNYFNSLECFKYFSKKLNKENLDKENLDTEMYYINIQDDDTVLFDSLHKSYIQDYV